MTPRSYTPAQRRALMALTGEWQKPHYKMNGACWSLYNHHNNLARAKFMFRGDSQDHPRPHWQYCLTPAGIAEQTRLRSENP